MEKVFLYCVLLLSCVACTDQLYQSTVPLNNRRTVVRGDTLHSFAIATDESSIKAQSEVSYTWYLRNDLTSTQGGYEGVLLDGPYTKMLRDNSLLEKGQFREGLKDGQWTIWYSDGMIKNTQEWNRGRRQGGQASYTIQGVLQQSQSFRKGEQHGKETVYLPYPGTSVKTRQVRTWTDGELTGPFVIYDSLDRMYQKGSYRNGQLDGKVTTYERHITDDQHTEVVEQVRTYQAGQRHGTFTERYADGHLKRTGTYRNDILHGKVTTYERLPTAKATQKNHYIKQIYSWKDGQYDGPFITYDADGDLQQKGDYRAGQLHGKLTTWDAEGEKSVQYYEEGQPVEKLKFSERMRSLKGKLKRKEQGADSEKVSEQLPNE